MKQNQQPIKHRPPAFTLIELLAVVAVIGVLAALILTAISAGSGRAKRIECANNVHQLAIGMQLFVSDNQVYPLGVNTGFSAGAEPDHMMDWRGALEKEFPRVKTNEIKNVWHCPSFHPPPSPDERIAYGWSSYGYNAFGLGMPLENTFGLGGHKGASPAGSEGPPVRESEVVRPSSMMAIGDGFYGGMHPHLSVRDGSRFLGRQRVVAEVGGQPPWTDKPGSTQRAESRHQGRANVALCDGHIEFLTLESLFVTSGDADLSRWNRDYQPHRERLAP